jgi:hypothetical protein
VEKKIDPYRAAGSRITDVNVQKKKTTTTKKQQQKKTTKPNQEKMCGIIALVNKVCYCH